MSKTNRELTEAEAFDAHTLDQYENLKDDDLVIPEVNLKQHLNLSFPPLRAYAYAIYLLKDSEIKDQYVLNIACGTGYESVILARKGGNVVSFDISPLSVRIAQKMAVVNKLSDKIHTEVMSVYDMKFSNQTFQYVYGNACLHHFDLDGAMKEMRRILKPGGVAVFHEPFSGSKLLQKIRDLVPIEKNVVSPDERQLDFNDISVIKRYFSSVFVKEFGLLSRFRRLIKCQCLHSLFYRIDNLLLYNIPQLKKYASHIVIEVTK